MMRFDWALLGFLGCTAIVGSAVADQPVKFVKEWRGKFLQREDEPLMKEVPKGRYIADEKAWAKLWKAWRGKEALPKVDFEKQLVLVGAAECARNGIRGNFRLTDKGDLRGGFAATELAGPGFVYMIGVIDREGIMTINGGRIEKGQ